MAGPLLLVAVRRYFLGGVFRLAERSKASGLSLDSLIGSVGSNPTPDILFFHGGTFFVPNSTAANFVPNYTAEGVGKHYTKLYGVNSI